MNYTALGQRIRQIRHQHDLTQAELADAIGVSTSFIGHIERGTRVLSMETFVQLCVALDTDPNTLLGAGEKEIRAITLNSQEREQLGKLLQYAAKLIREP